MKRNVIFGTGNMGLKALKELGKENVDYFLSNNTKKQGSTFSDIPIISPESFIELHKEAHVVVASIYAESLALQLKKLGITDFSILDRFSQRIQETDDLVVNPYFRNKENVSEEEWNEHQAVSYARENVEAAAAMLQEEETVLFNRIEVETINRCNGSCSFCPVNSRDDPREKKVMTEELFQSIVDQLAKLNYSGRFTTFSNNEPLLDKRIIEFNRYARQRLPLAKMYLYTNGTLFTLEKFKALIEVLDELIIDNYDPNLELIEPCKEIQNYCEQHPELTKKVTIVLRNPQEILTSRGGNAPNRKEIMEYPDDKCVLPFKQMIVRPDGKVSLCCNDALGEHTLGDLSEESILDVWYGEKFQQARAALLQGRKNLGKCRYCDTFYT